MKGTNKGIVLALPLLAAFASLALAEPSYLIYPNSPAVFRYDPARYDVLTSGDPRFNPAYAIGNQMLWDRIEGRLPIEVYRAPLITSFEMSSNGLNEFVTIGNDIEIVIDGFAPAPRTIGGLCVRFRPTPDNAFVQLDVGSGPISGLTQALPALEVSTAMGGGFYSDTRRFVLSWVGSAELRIIAFSDKDADRVFDGKPLFTVVVRDATVPAAPTTWGQIKAKYRN